MAVKQVVVSDISGDEVRDDQHARVVISDYPGLTGGPVELDVSVAEAERFQTSKIDLVTLDVYEPNKPRRSVVLEVGAIKELFEGIEMDDVVAGARRASSRTAPAAGQSRPRSGGQAVKIDYTASDRYGQVHRGRVTDEEAKLVRENQDQASKNRVSQGHPPIDWNDPKEGIRYRMF